jgi:hypothetical protein
MSESELKKMSKKELEDRGRTLGIELDRRESKWKLVQQVLEAEANVYFAETEEEVVEEISVVQPETVSTNSEYVLEKNGSFWTVQYNGREVKKSSSLEVCQRFIASK